LPSPILRLNNRDGKNAVICRHPLKKEVFPMQGKPPQSKPPPRPARRVSPAEWAWLDRINRQLAYDEYMQAKREYWLAARPARGESDRA
jgi:hypothetical protein